MLQATHTITIGTDRYKSPANSRLVSLEHSARMDTLVNVCRIALSPPEGLSVSPGEDISVELGDGGRQTKVFTGVVETVDRRIQEIIIEAAGSARKLTLASYNMYFEQSPAGNIVRSICQEAGVSVGQTQPGLSFEYFAVGSNSNAASQIRSLAIQSGFDAFVDTEDRLYFGLPVPSGVHLLQYGVNVLSLRVQEPMEGIGKTTTFGESPASFGQGPAAASWLSKKEVSASTGSGMERQVFDPAIRTNNQAALIARNYQAAFKSHTQGIAVVLGNPKIKLGDTVQISRMPAGDQNGMYKVIGTGHVVSRRQGFITRLLIESV